MRERTVTRGSINWEHWRGPLMGRPIRRVWLVLLVIAGVMGVVFFKGPGTTVDYDAEHDMPEGSHLSWDTEAGWEDAVRYEVSVMEGGRVDVYLATDSAHPRVETLQGHSHEGVMRA